MSTKRDFKVLIAGGGVAGLTLANMLEKLNIDYQILESYKSLTPQVGASLGLAPNGLRILDQIDLADDIATLIPEPEKNQQMRLRAPGGKALFSYDNTGKQIYTR